MNKDNDSVVGVRESLRRRAGGHKDEIPQSRESITADLKEWTDSYKKVRLPELMKAFSAYKSLHNVKVEHNG
jgi:hypothetical protein